jgi:GTPase SAR1 family protein
MYSVTSRESFKEVNLYYDQILCCKDTNDFPIVLVGYQFI